MELLSKLVTAAVSPLGTALVLGAVAIAFTAIRRAPRMRLGIGSFALAWLTVWSTPIASELLAAAVEADFPPIALSSMPKAEAIVVLGGGVVPRGPGRPYPDMTNAADRVWHAARLFHSGKAPLILASGGGASALEIEPEADAMQMLLHDLGVPAERVLLERDSRNTRENAQYSAVLLRARGIQRVLLVTSAMHMARAASDFEAMGVIAEPAAVDHVGTSTHGHRWIPTAKSLEISSRAMKEVVARLLIASSPLFVRASGST